jgi:hypothetical protein
MLPRRFPQLRTAGRNVVSAPLPPGSVSGLHRLFFQGQPINASPNPAKNLMFSIDFFYVGKLLCELPTYKHLSKMSARCNSSASALWREAFRTVKLIWPHVLTCGNLRRDGFGFSLFVGCPRKANLLSLPFGCSYHWSGSSLTKLRPTNVTFCPCCSE